MASKPVGSQTTATLSPESPEPQDQAALFRDMLHRLPHLEDPIELMDLTVEGIELFLSSRKDEALRHDLVLQATDVAWKHDLTPLARAHACVRILQQARDQRSKPEDPVEIQPEISTAPADAAATFKAVNSKSARPAEPIVNDDISYKVPDELQHLTKRIQLAIPAVEERSGFKTFPELVEAAIIDRINATLCYFQITSPNFSRELPPAFLQSPLFAERMTQVIKELIIPTFNLGDRTMRASSELRNWSDVGTFSFWKIVDTPVRDLIMKAWRNAWSDLNLVESEKRGETRVWQIKPNTKILRSILMPTSGEYTLNSITNKEIGIFLSLFDANINWPRRLNAGWTRIRDYYEQEMEPRVQQQQARAGAFRDVFLDILLSVPREWRDFVILTAHRSLGRLNVAWLVGFTKNFARSEADRERELPYLFAYIHAASEHPTMRERERLDEGQNRATYDSLKLYLRGK
jgi:hypothetical protein